MKTMRPLGYLNNVFVATDELGHVLYHYTLLATMNQKIFSAS